MDKPRRAGCTGRYMQVVRTLSTSAVKYFVLTRTKQPLSKVLATIDMIVGPVCDKESILSVGDELLSARIFCLRSNGRNGASLKKNNITSSLRVSFACLRMSP